MTVSPLRLAAVGGLLPYTTAGHLRLAAVGRLLPYTTADDLHPRTRQPPLPLPQPKTRLDQLGKGDHARVPLARPRPTYDPASPSRRSASNSCTSFVRASHSFGSWRWTISLLSTGTGIPCDPDRVLADRPRDDRVVAEAPDAQAARPSRSAARRARTAAGGRAGRDTARSAPRRRARALGQTPARAPGWRGRACESRASQSRFRARAQP